MKKYIVGAVSGLIFGMIVVRMASFHEGFLNSIFILPAFFSGVIFSYIGFYLSPILYALLGSIGLGYYSKWQQSHFPNNLYVKYAPILLFIGLFINVGLVLHDQKVFREKNEVMSYQVALEKSALEKIKLSCSEDSTSASDIVNQCVMEKIIEKSEEGSLFQLEARRYKFILACDIKYSKAKTCSAFVQNLCQQSMKQEYLEPTGYEVRYYSCLDEQQYESGSCPDLINKILSNSETQECLDRK